MESPLTAEAMVLLSDETTIPSSCKYWIDSMFLLVTVIWFPCAYFDNPSAMATPRFPPPMMCAYIVVRLKDFEIEG